jgi:hypothetical protein
MSSDDCICVICGEPNENWEDMGDVCTMCMDGSWRPPMCRCMETCSSDNCTFFRCVHVSYTTDDPQGSSNIFPAECRNVMCPHLCTPGAQHRALGRQVEKLRAEHREATDDGFEIPSASRRNILRRFSNLQAQMRVLENEMRGDACASYK